MAKTTKTKEVLRIPGPKQFQAFLRLNSKLINFSEVERQCDFPSGTLRHICAGSREMDNGQYKKVQQVLLPKLCELIFLLQNYEANGNHSFNRFLDGDDY